MGWLSGLRWINQYLTSRRCSDWWISSAHLPLSSTLTTKPNTGCHEASDQYPPGKHRWAWVQPWDFSQPTEPKAGPLRRGSKHTQAWWDHILSQKSAKSKITNEGQNKNKTHSLFSDSMSPTLPPTVLTRLQTAACRHDAACSSWLHIKKCVNPEWSAEPHPPPPHPHHTEQT